jgi:hypothetical protein
LSRASAKPVRRRSRRTLCSNAANTESSPAMARPVGVVRSRASCPRFKLSQPARPVKVILGRLR